MASTNWLSGEKFARLSSKLQAWLRELDDRDYDAEGKWKKHIEARLNIASSHKGRVIPKDLRGRFALPGTDYQFQVYASGTAPRKRKVRRYGPFGMKRVYAICPECGKEVEAGHVRQHAFKHVPKGDVDKLTAEVRGLLK